LADRDSCADRISHAAAGRTPHRPLWREAGLSRGDGLLRAVPVRHQPGDQLRRVHGRGSALRDERGFVRGRDRVLVGLLPPGASGDGSGHLRDGERWERDHDAGRPDDAQGVHRRRQADRGLADLADGVWCRPPRHGGAFRLADDESPGRALGTTIDRRNAIAAARCARLAFRALLLSGVWRVRRPRPVARAVLPERLRNVAGDGGSAGVGVLVALGGHPSAGRVGKRQVRCPRNDVLGVEFVCAVLLPARRSADGDRVSGRGGDGRIRARG